MILLYGDSVLARMNLDHSVFSEILSALTLLISYLGEQSRFMPTSDSSYLNFRPLFILTCL